MSQLTPHAAAQELAKLTREKRAELLDDSFTDEAWLNEVRTHLKELVNEKEWME